MMRMGCNGKALQTSSFFSSFNFQNWFLSPSGLQHATTLQKLKLWDCESLAAIPEWIGNLKSLKDFEIRGCSSLTSLPEGMGRLTSLKYLTIRNCLGLELANDEDGVQFKSLTSLLYLSFTGLPKLVSLPSALQHATSLQHLYITDCESLVAIPEWIYNFKSLKDFRIKGCSSLTSLPEGMGRLTSLKSLSIENCPILLRRCKKDTGEDWTKIAHVPELHIW
jgi:Leucine-rich repeat (LRR) protein